MKDDRQILEERLTKVKNAYYNMGDFIDSLPKEVPDSIKKTLKKAFLEDEELKRMMQGIEEHRPPRFLLVGRTGVGKSSLINAMCGAYVAEVSDVRVGTKDIEPYACRDGERILLEIMDSRGIGESDTLAKKDTAESALLEKIVEFRPDAILFVLKCKARDRIQEDVKFVRQLKETYLDAVGVAVPVIVVLNQADELEPSQYKNPTEYPHRKLDNIAEAQRETERILKNNGVQAADIIPVSSLIDWGYSPEEIADMPPEQVAGLQMELDGRYHIDQLIESISNSLEVDASMGLLMAAGLNGTLERIAMKIVKICSGISAAVATTPIPLSDMVVLSAIQLLMVVLVGFLAGENISWKSAQKFVVNALGIGVGGQLFRLTARQLSKLIPFAGTVINSTVAYNGTLVIGKMAVQHYIYGIDLRKLRKKKNQERV